MSEVSNSAEVAATFGIAVDSPHFEEALTHPSFSNERPGGADYQRLEFLGDAVLEMCVSETLFERFPEAKEGELTRRRANIVNARALAKFASETGLASALRLGRGADASGLRSSTNVLADAVEAVIAAVYLDVGMFAARQICARIVESALLLDADEPVDDPKTALQERVQSAGSPTPVYEVDETWGPAHERTFRVSVRVGDDVLAHGVGRSKRDAERDAAGNALDLIDERPTHPGGDG